MTNNTERQYIKLTAILTKTLYDLNIYDQINWRYYIDYYDFDDCVPYDRFWRSMQWRDPDIPDQLTLFFKRCYKKNSQNSIKMIFEITQDSIPLIKVNDFLEDLNREYNFLKKLNPPEINNFEFEYDIAISFAGEDRDIAEKIASGLRENNVKVFYDKFETIKLWGKDLYQQFQEIFGTKSKYILVIISKHYPVKDWTNYELSIAKNALKKGRKNFILPLRIDDTPLVGLKDSIGYIEYKNNEKEIVSLLIKKIQMDN